MTIFVHLYCVIWIALLAVSYAATGELILQLAFLLSLPATRTKVHVKLAFTLYYRRFDRRFFIREMLWKIMPYQIED